MSAIETSAYFCDWCQKEFARDRDRKAHQTSCHGHGHHNTYSTGCHCDECRAAEARHVAERRRASAGVTRLAGDLARPEWMDRSACGPEDIDLLYSVWPLEQAAAKELCSGCPVRAECLEHALTHDENQGIWGGQSERQRRTIRRQRRNTR